jgi:predicted enzyme related to lactoylglutathione lyase
MSIDLLAVSFDCTDAARLAGFWAAVLDRKVSDDATPESASVTADGVASTGPLLLFHRVPEGKTVKNRVHLDLATTDSEAESARLLELGATRLRDITEDGRLRWTTFADPEGNEFDLIVR